MFTETGQCHSGLGMLPDIATGAFLQEHISDSHSHTVRSAGWLGRSVPAGTFFTFGMPRAQE